MFCSDDLWELSAGLWNGVFECFGQQLVCPFTSRFKPIVAVSCVNKEILIFINTAVNSLNVCTEFSDFGGKFLIPIP